MAQKPLTIEQALELASRQAAAGNHPVARKLYQQILNVMPGHEVARRELGRLPPEQGAAASASNFDADARNLMAIYSSGDLELALKEAQRLCELHDGHPMLLSIKGAILLELERFQEARDATRASLELAPRQAGSWVNLGSAQLECDELEAAVASFRQALALDQAPAMQAAASRGMGKALAKLGHFAPAREAFEKALSVQPADTATRVAYAGTLLETVGREAATDELTNAANGDPSSALPRLELGKIQLAERDYDLARQNLEAALELAPDRPGVHQSLGQLYAKTGQREQAIAAYQRCLQLDPDSAEVRHFLDVVQGNASTAAPAEYVEDMFDDFAANFEKSLVGSLGYQGPEIIREMVTEAGVAVSSALDLGCGTGLMGESLRGLVTRMDGVDLSRRMLDRAQDKGIYNQLQHGDIAHAASLFEGDYDLVVAADVVIYFGDLAPVVEVAVEKTRPGSLLCFSTELLQQEGDYQLLGSGRYSHSAPYITAMFEDAGFKLLQFREAPLRQEDQQWLNGGFYLFSRV